MAATGDAVTAISAMAIAAMARPDRFFMRELLPQWRWAGVRRCTGAVDGGRATDLPRVPPRRDHGAPTHRRAEVARVENVVRPGTGCPTIGTTIRGSGPEGRQQAGTVS